MIEGGTGRVTEHAADKLDPPDWWPRFFARHHRDTGRSAGEVRDLLRRLRGDRWTELSEEEADRLVEGQAGG